MRFTGDIETFASLKCRDRRTPATTDGGGNTYRSGGIVSMNCACVSHARITTAPVGVSPSTSGSWSPPIPAQVVGLKRNNHLKTT